MNKLDWNYERYRTRDRLLEYQVIIVPKPRLVNQAFFDKIENGLANNPTEHLPVNGMKETNNE